MERLTFWLALWAGKLCVWVYKLLGKEFDDRPGMLAMKICYHFMTYVNKPKLNVVVTGTNGKTTMTYLLANMLQKNGQKTIYNKWGANANAGQAICLLQCVNIFNRPIVDAVILESDELLGAFSFPQLKPNYIIVSNIARDSMFRNASPDFIFNKMNEGIALTPDSTVLLNADDPISSQLAADGKRVFYGVCNLHKPDYPHHINDFASCTVCGHQPVYNYRNYRHIGDYYCPNCGFKAPERQFMLSEITGDHLTVSEYGKEKHEYPVISDDVHNLYNFTAIIALLRHAGYKPETIAHLLSQIKMPNAREFATKVNGVDVICKTLKTQNSTGTSVTMESLAEEEGNMVVIVDMDEEFTGSRANLCEVGTYL
ncbi:MAG: hypothetical protein IJI05_01030 [Erysipelotrichaceae bacterium]|nr:hypothetical protein [Erysipelotrichaceae bacterium]